IDIARDLIPVSPAAHYPMGGVRADTHARTSLPGMYAAGEVACTAVHGANRLASNSLLEGFELGPRAGLCAAAEATSRIGGGVPRDTDFGATTDWRIDDGTLAEVKRTMWARVGIVREEAGLREALLELQKIAGRDLNTRSWNLVTLARLITEAALERREPRGAHYRSDYPSRHDEKLTAHTLQAKP